MNLAVLGLLPEPPVLVASGINHGSNLGDDVTYSGTVSAAMEGTLLGVPSMAVSQADAEAAAASRRRARSRGRWPRGSWCEGLPRQDRC